MLMSRDLMKTIHGARGACGVKGGDVVQGHSDEG